MEENNFDLEKIWRTVLEALKTEVSQGTFNTYIRNTELLTISDSGERKVCEIGCPSAYMKNTLEQRYMGQISGELEKVMGNKCETVFKIIQHREIDDHENDQKLPLFNTDLVQKRPYDWKRSNLKEDFTFDNYAVSNSNQMAYAAAQAVAKKPGITYNPLFIYGGVGVGKTHLMQAVGHEILKENKGSVLFCSGEEFTNDLVEAIRYKTTEKVRAKYRKVTLLLIDDVQFIAGKPTVQEEFFHTFNAVMKDGGQVVMTSDKPPGEISKLEERLKSRFGAGLIVDIGPADFELRTAILLIKAKQRGSEMAMEKAQLIATKIEGVRELQGFLAKLETEEKVRGKSLELNEIEKLLLTGNGNLVTKAKVVTPGDVINTIGSFYNVGVQQLKGNRRNKPVVWPRQILMYLLRVDLELPLEEVGRLIGGRDHTTVMHAENKIKRELDENRKLQTEITEIKKIIFGSG